MDPLKIFIPYCKWWCSIAFSRPQWYHHGLQPLGFQTYPSTKLRNCEASGPLDSGCITQSCGEGGKRLLNGMVLSMFFVFVRLGEWCQKKSCFIQNLENSEEEESYHESLEIGDGVKIQYHLPPISMVQWKMVPPIVVTFQIQPFSTSLIFGEEHHFFRFFWCLRKDLDRFSPSHLLSASTTNFRPNKTPTGFLRFLTPCFFKTHARPLFFCDWSFKKQISVCDFFVYFL